MLIFCKYKYEYEYEYLQGTDETLFIPTHPLVTSISLNTFVFTPTKMNVNPLNDADI